MEVFFHNRSLPVLFHKFLEQIFECRRFNARVDFCSELLKQAWVFFCIIACFWVVIDTSKDLYANVVFSGGSTMFPRFGEGHDQKDHCVWPVHDENEGDGSLRPQVFDENVWICLVFSVLVSFDSCFQKKKKKRTHLLTSDSMLHVESSPCNSARCASRTNASFFFHKGGNVQTEKSLFVLMFPLCGMFFGSSCHRLQEMTLFLRTAAFQ